VQAADAKFEYRRDSSSTQRRCPSGVTRKGIDEGGRAGAPGQPGNVAPSQRRTPQLQGDLEMGGRRRQRNGRDGAIRKFPRRRDQRRAIRGDPAIGPLAKPEGALRGDPKRSDQPEPEDSDCGATRRKNHRRYRRAVPGATRVRSIGTAERTGEPGQPGTRSPAKPDRSSKRGNPQAESAARQARPDASQAEQQR